MAGQFQLIGPQMWVVHGGRSYTSCEIALWYVEESVIGLIER